MTEKIGTNEGMRLLFGAAALVVIIWGLNQAQAALMSSLVAVFLAVLGTPLVLWLQRKRVPSALAVLAVFLSLIFWGRLLGLVGAVLCIPLTMALKFAFENNKNTRWLAVLLGPAVPENGAHHK